MGPILFREEALFKREIKFGDSVTVDVELVKASADFSRWSMRHNFVKPDGTLSAIINIDGAWINIIERKLAKPTEFIQQIFNDLPRAADFTLLDLSKK